jgi:hypothetical protein
MSNTVEAVGGSTGYLKASMQFEAPQTLQVRVKKERNLVSRHMGRYGCVFIPEREAELVSYIKNMEQRLIGFTTT